MVNLDLSDFIDALGGEEFDERPVEIEEFVVSEKYLALPPLSELQYQMIKAATQIYKLDTLINLYGEERGTRRFTQTFNEVIYCLGKGSGKDYTSTISCAYVVYLLLCLKNPATYYGKPDGDAIDIINVAVNAAQAKNVFFKGFKNRIDKSPWFVGKYHAKADSIEFEKSITVHSGHSEREAWEGFNLIFCVLDEISAFNMESTTGHQTAKTAGEIYKMFRASVDSRFPEYGKLALLSFPRFKGDFISQRYDDVVLDKEVKIREHTFVIDEGLPPGVDGNEFDIEWEEDHIVSYKYPKVYALKRPTWEVNPTISLHDLKNAFMSDPQDALSRFAAMPPDMVDAFFPSRDKINTAFCNPHMAVDSHGVWDRDFLPNDNREYFMHVDLAQKHDRCAVSMAHIDSWVNMTFGNTNEVYAQAPRVVVDFVRYWIPTAEKSVDLSVVKDFIVEVKRKGFNIKLVTFDRWSSHSMMQELADYGIYTEILSVAKKHYDDFKLAVLEERVIGPADQLLIEELVKLKIVRDRVDHPRCFVGETRIPLLDGTIPMMSELDGSSFWVYSNDGHGNVVPGYATCFVSGHTTRLLDVILDSGAVIRCTPEHLFMLRNGEYKEAQALVPGIDRLMPLNRQWPQDGGYERVNSLYDRARLTHRVVAEHYEKIPEGYIVHHIDGDKINNVPDNLEVMAHSDHVSHHLKMRHSTDSEWVSNLRDGVAKFNKLESTRLKRSNYMKSLPKGTMAERAKKKKSYRSDITIDKLIEASKDSGVDNANAASKLLGCGRNVVLRVLREHGYSSWDELVSSSGSNHKVRAIVEVTLDEAVPVYDLHVPEWHNFGLSAGVFVHNSGFKDLSDATCGAIFNAIKRSNRHIDREVEVHTFTETKKDNVLDPSVIKVPRAEMPTDLHDYMKALKVI